MSSREIEDFLQVCYRFLELAERGSRLLNPKEIITLENNNCICSDWCEVRIFPRDSELEAGLMRSVVFSRSVILIDDCSHILTKETYLSSVLQSQSECETKKTRSKRGPNGVTNSEITHSVIFYKDISLSNCTLECAFVCPNTHARNCLIVGITRNCKELEDGSCKQNEMPVYGNGTTMRIGSETSLNPIQLNYSLTFNGILQFLENRRLSAETSGNECIRRENNGVNVDRMIFEDANNISIQYKTNDNNHLGFLIGGDAVLCSIVSPNSYLLNSKIFNSLIRENCNIQDSHIKNSSLFNNAKVVSSTIKNTIIRFNATVDTYSVVESSLLSEYSAVSTNGVIKESVIGSYTRIEKAEVSHSLVGPLVGIHHNCLLISALWPEGRGNIGCGALVGANHTGRCPDQSIYAPEGLFVGLGATVRYPCNFEGSYYTFLASGSKISPMRLSMPFSLVSNDGVVPGFALVYMMYGLVRNEIKHRYRQITEINHQLDTILTTEGSDYRKLVLHKPLYPVGIFRTEIAKQVALSYMRLDSNDTDLHATLNIISTPMSILAYKFYLAYFFSKTLFDEIELILTAGNNKARGHKAYNTPNIDEVYIFFTDIFKGLFATNREVVIARKDDLEKRVPQIVSSCQFNNTVRPSETNEINSMNVGFTQRKGLVKEFVSEFGFIFQAYKEWSLSEYLDGVTISSVYRSYESDILKFRDNEMYDSLRQKPLVAVNHINPILDFFQFSLACSYELLYLCIRCKKRDDSRGISIMGSNYMVDRIDVKCDEVCSLIKSRCDDILNTILRFVD